MVKRVYKVIRTGNRTTLISVGKFIPKDWNYFVIEKVEKLDGEIVIRLKKVEI